MLPNTGACAVLQNPKNHIRRNGASSQIEATISCRTNNSTNRRSTFVKQGGTAKAGSDLAPLKLYISPNFQLGPALQFAGN
jgi:hypothetical protein